MKFSSFDAYCRQSNALDEEAAKRIDEYQAGHKNWMTEGGKGGTFRHRGILLEEGTAVWMGCDVGKQMDRKRGLWDASLFESQALYGVEFGMDKAARLRFGQTMMTHAMLFTGVDVVDGKPRRWRVENSWGKENGVKGFYTMNDNWFDEYMFEIAARRSALPQELQSAFEQDPIVLPAWDPMGSLAR